MRSGGEQAVHPMMNSTGAQMLQPRIGPVGSSQPRRKWGLPGREATGQEAGEQWSRKWSLGRLGAAEDGNITGPPVICAHELTVSLFPNKSFFQLNYASWAHDSAGRKSQGCRFAKEIIMT